MMKKHQRAYTSLVEETANRATGGILQSNSENAYYMSKQNKSARSNEWRNPPSKERPRLASPSKRAPPNLTG